MLDIFTDPKFDESIKGEQLHTYHPQTKAFDYNDTVDILIYQQDVFMDMSEATLIVEGMFEEQTGGDGVCTLTNNPAAFMFSDITYELNGKEVEKVRDPGIVSTIRGLLTYNTDESRTLSIAGWNPTGDQVMIHAKRFSFTIPVKFLFSIFSDYRKAIFGKHLFRLTRALNDSNCYISKKADGSPGTKRAKITINNIELRVKHIFTSDAVKLRLLPEISKDRPILIAFRKWELHELPALGNSSKDLWSIKTASSVERPRYVVVAFQENRKNDPTKDIVKFDHINISDIRLQLNSELYPFERMKVDFGRRQYAEAYMNMINFQRSFYGKQNAESVISYDSFKDNALYVFDCSRHVDALKPTTVDIKLIIESTANFPATTKAYAIIIHDTLIEYHPLSGDVKYLM